MALLEGNKDGIRTFAILYVFGNIIALSATAFLIGPKSHCEKMFAETRRYSCIFYLLMLIVVFVVAVTKQPIELILFLLLIQMCAAIWYSVSYIPFGRKMLLGCLRNTVCYPCKEMMQDEESGNRGNGR